MEALITWLIKPLRDTSLQGNLKRIREAVLDGARAYGLAAVLEFQKSDLYPTEAEIPLCCRATGDHAKFLMLM